MKAKIELVTVEDVKRFSEIARGVSCDVRLTGKDENGSDWAFSAKSLLCSLILESKIKYSSKESSPHNVDWGSIWVECEEDIYSLIKDFVVAGETDSTN